MFNRRTLLLATCLMGSAAAPAGAQEQVFQPLTEYMNRYVSDPADTDALRYLARRCGATMLIVSALPENRDQRDLVDGYSAATTTFIHLAVVIEESSGMETTRALAVTEEAIEELSLVVKQRLDENRVASGSYLENDPVITGDIEICTALSQRLRRSVPTTPSV